MRLDLDKNQYMSLIKLVCLGNEVANGLRGNDDRISKFDDVASWLLGQAERFGCGRYVAACHCQGEPHAVPSEKLFDDPDYRMCIEDYEDELFWTELEERLADRDLRRQEGERQVNKLSDAEFEAKLTPLLDRYMRETERHGIERLEVKE